MRRFIEDLQVDEENRLRESRDLQQDIAKLSDNLADSNRHNMVLAMELEACRGTVKQEVEMCKSSLIEKIGELRKEKNILSHIQQNVFLQFIITNLYYGYKKCYSKFQINIQVSFSPLVCY